MARPNSRQQIVDAAIRLMAGGGAEALTASALAEAAGVSKANLFHHFTSLDDIVLVAFEQFIMGMQSVTGAPPASLRQWLIELGAEAADTITQQATLSGAYFAFASRAQSDPRLRARLEELVAMAEGAFAEIIGQLAPGMDASSARALASLLVFAGDGLVLHRALFPGRAAAQDAGWLAFVDLIAPKENIK